MNAVIYISYTFNSESIAKFCSEYLNFRLIRADKIDLEANFNNVVLVFPIHSEDAPKIIKNILKNIKCKKMIVIASYGRINQGNIIYRIRYKYRMPLVGGCYFPTKHSYLKFDDCIYNYTLLIPLLNKFDSVELIDVPKEKSTFGYNFFPILRAKYNIKIFKNKICKECNLCGQNCFNKAIKNGKINKNCIRCLRCVKICPNQSLDFKMKPILKLYLKKEKKAEPTIYL